MSIDNDQFLAFLNELLQPERVRDFCPNGMQVEGKKQIKSVVTGVTASQNLIDEAIRLEADAILVHHGYFWKGEDPCIKGMKKQRLKALLSNDINLYAYHLPLDIHPTLGNNAQLAKLLGIEIEGGLEAGNATSVAMRGNFETPLDAIQLGRTIEVKLGRKPLHEASSKKLIQSVAWCTGGGQNYIEMAAEQGVDAYITGEVSEQTIHTAREMDIHFYAAGHHATERYGVKALGEHIAQKLGLTVQFVDIPNPA
ncbi:MAG: dinuclear metal center YbgI/SA1388 family protein [Paraglaciecola sp.]|jgi:dinuclear metal center YbgI/SA1388 family protein